MNAVKGEDDSKPAASSCARSEAWNAGPNSGGPPSKKFTGRLLLGEDSSKSGEIGIEYGSNAINGPSPIEFEL